MSEPASPKPFQEITETDYPARFLGTGFRSEPIPSGGVVVYGKCPRCEAPIEAAFPSALVKSATTLPAPAGQTASDTHTIPCNCACAHPGRPAEFPDGCGAYWGLTMVRTTS